MLMTTNQTIMINENCFLNGNDLPQTYDGFVFYPGSGDSTPVTTGDGNADMICHIKDAAATTTTTTTTVAAITTTTTTTTVYVAAPTGYVYVGEPGMCAINGGRVSFWENTGTLINDCSSKCSPLVGCVAFSHEQRPPLEVCVLYGSE